MSNPAFVHYQIVKIAVLIIYKQRKLDMLVDEQIYVWDEILVVLWSYDDAVSWKYGWMKKKQWQKRGIVIHMALD